MKRKRMQADYERRMGEDGKNVYVYTGPRFSLDMPQKKRRRFYALCWLAPLLMLAIWLSVGLLNTGGMRQMYVALPYVAIFMPLCLMLGDAYKITTSKENMQRAEYERSFQQMKRCTAVTLAFSLVALLGQAVYTVFFAEDARGPEAVLISGLLLLAALPVFWLKEQKKLTFSISR